MYTSPQMYDFYSPFMAAVIISPEGYRVPLWTNTNASGTETIDGVSARLATGLRDQEGYSYGGLVSLPFLQSVTIKLDLAYLPQMTAVLTPPMRDAQAILDSSIMEWGQSVLQVQFGYSAGTGTGGAELSPVFEGLMFKPEVSMGGPQYTITLKTQGVAGYSMGVAQNQTVFNGTRREIIEKVIAGQGTDKRALTVVFKDIEKDSGVNLLLNERISTQQAGLTDWMFLWQLIREAGCWVSYTGRVSGDQASNKNETRHTDVIIYPRNVALDSEPKLQLRFFDFPGGKIGGMSGSPGVYPILSASSPTSAVYLPGATRALVAQGISSKTGKPVEAVATPENTFTPRIGGGAVGVKSNPNSPGANSKTGAGGAPLPAWADDPKFEALPKTELAAFFTMGVKLEVQTLGIPDIQPGDVVSVKGLGGRFDFNYAVFSVVHQLGSGGFFTSLSLQSNTSRILSNFIPGAGTSNYEPSEESRKINIDPKGRRPVPGLENDI